MHTWSRLEVNENDCGLYILEHFLSPKQHVTTKIMWLQVMSMEMVVSHLRQHKTHVMLVWAGFVTRANKEYPPSCSRNGLPSSGRFKPAWRSISVNILDYTGRIFTYDKSEWGMGLSKNTYKSLMKVVQIPGAVFHTCWSRAIAWGTDQRDRT